MREIKTNMIFVWQEEERIPLGFVESQNTLIYIFYAWNKTVFLENHETKWEILRRI